MADVLDGAWASKGAGWLSCGFYSFGSLCGGSLESWALGLRADDLVTTLLIYLGILNSFAVHSLLRFVLNILVTLFFSCRKKY